MYQKTAPENGVDLFMAPVSGACVMGITSSVRRSSFYTHMYSDDLSANCMVGRLHTETCDRKELKRSIHCSN